jgi:hypothetical protein
VLEGLLVDRVASLGIHLLECAEESPRVLREPEETKALQDSRQPEMVVIPAPEPISGALVERVGSSKSAAGAPEAVEGDHAVERRLDAGAQALVGAEGLDLLGVQDGSFGDESASRLEREQPLDVVVRLLEPRVGPLEDLVDRAATARPSSASVELDQGTRQLAMPATVVRIRSTTGIESSGPCLGFLKTTTLASRT